jgi:hypothetical protein
LLQATDAFLTDRKQKTHEGMTVQLKTYPIEKKTEKRPYSAKVQACAGKSATLLLSMRTTSLEQSSTRTLRPSPISRKYVSST